jgi:hypothetical protein
MWTTNYESLPTSLSKAFLGFPTQVAKVGGSYMRETRFTTQLDSCGSLLACEGARGVGCSRADPLAKFGSWN